MKKLIILLFLCSVCHGTIIYDDLIPNTTGIHDIGSDPLYFDNAFFSGEGTFLTRVISQIWTASTDPVGGKLSFGTAIGLDQLKLEALSGTNTNLRFLLKPKGTGEAFIEASGVLNIVDVTLVTSEGKITALESASEGLTESLELFGFRTGDQLRSMTVGVGEDESDSVSFAGLSKYIFDGDFDLANNALTNIGYIDFETGAVAPAHSEGRVFYDDDEKTLSVYNNESDVTLQLGQEMYIRATNKTGSTILNGALVYIDGAQGSRPTIALAKADAVATCQVLAMATHDIADNATGFVTTSGLVHDVNTDGITAGDALYLSATTAGVYTDTLQTAPDFVIQVGRCIFENSTSGLIYIDIGPTAVCRTMVIQDLDINTNLDVAGDITADDITGTSLTLDLGNDYKFDDRGAGGALAIQNLATNVSSNLELFTFDGDGADDLTIRMYGIGLPSDITTAAEYAELAYDAVPSGGPRFALRSLAAGTGTVRPWNIYTGANTSQLVLATDGNISMAGDLTVNDLIIGDARFIGSASDTDAIQIEADGDVVLTQILRIPTNLSHVGDPDTSLTFTDDQIDFFAGGVKMLTFDEFVIQNAIIFNEAGVDVDLRVESVGQTHALFVQGSDGAVGIRESAPQDTLEVNGTILVKDKLKFTQDDGNEYIDSLADGYLDYSGTTAHRFNMSVADTDVRLEFVGTTNSGLLEWMEDEDAFYFNDDVEVASTEGIFFGDINTNGSWRIIRSGDDLIVERRESGSWVEKGAFTP